MTKTKYGYLHLHYGPDMDGCSRSFTWVEDVRPADFDDLPLQPGWFAMCEVEPDAGWVGPFATEAEAIRVATDEDALHAWHIGQMGDDPTEELDEEQVYDLYGDEGRIVR